MKSRLRVRALDHIRDHGRIINISTGFARIAPAFGPRGITVNAVMPGVTATDMNADWLAVPEARAGAEAASVFSRVGQAAEVADVITLVASNEARWMTGQVIDATGGVRL